MPTLYRRTARDGTPAKTWTANVQYKGVRINRDTRCVSKAEARRWIERAKQEIDASAIEQSRRRGTTGDLWLSEALALYVEEKLQHSKSFEKSESYVIDNMAKRIQAHRIKLAELSTQHVARYISKRQSEVSGSTIIRELTILKAAHNWAVDVWEHDCRNIAWKKIWPKKRERARHKPSPTEVQKLLGAASPRLARLIKAAVLTGLRLAELKNLTWQAVNLDNRTVTVLGKGDKEVILPLSSAAISLLSSQSRASSKHVFDTTNFRREWDECREQAKLQHIVFHGLRHATASWLNELGLPVQTIQGVMRHSDTATTSRYTGTSERLVSDAFEQIALKMNEISPTRTGESQNQTGGQSED